MSAWEYKSGSSSSPRMAWASEKPVHASSSPGHLRYWEQCTFIEIGIRMNRSPEAARKLWYRAVGEFNTHLGRRRAGEGGVL